MSQNMHLAQSAGIPLKRKRCVTVFAAETDSGSDLIEVELKVEGECLSWFLPASVSLNKDTRIRTIHIKTQRPMYLSAGMMCDGCTSSVQAALEKAPGARSVSVDLKSGIAKVQVRRPDDVDGRMTCCDVTDINSQPQHHPGPIVHH